MEFQILIYLQNKIKEISSECYLKNYNGLRWISQPAYAIKNTSLKDFYDWEINLDDALKKVNTNSSLEFVFKNYNYENENNEDLENRIYYACCILPRLL